MLLQGCPPSPPPAVTAAENNVCTAASSSPDIAQAYMTISGSVINGNVSNSAIIENHLTYAALAKTSDEYRHITAHPGYCCGWVTPYYYACGMFPMCVQEQSDDLRDVYGLARGQTSEEAEDLAMKVCEDLAEQRADEIGASSANDAFDCHIVRSSACQ
jgi:hypothetical protein